MIDISPKALRFARLAAEQLPVFSDDRQIAFMKRDEEAFRQKDSRDRIGHTVKISDRTAEFCVRAVTALLDMPDQFDSFEWDGNDFAFLRAVTKSLRDQLTHANAPLL